jgi:acetolactate synthase-1/2/3 large subunit
MIQEQGRGTIPQERKGRPMTKDVNTLAELIVACLEAEGVEYMFGRPGEENIRLIEAIGSSNIR